MSSHTPRVTIGLPVRNGARYLYETIHTLLHQTFTDFELVLSDNASDDKTRQICEQFAAQDSRVQYNYFTENVGASRNFNILATRARGEYFKWAACDDLVGDDYLRACVEVLDADPEAVLCYTIAGRVNESNEARGLCELDRAFDADSPARRFSDLINVRHESVALYGVIRTEVLRRTPMIEPYVGSDRGLLAELGLYGRLRQVQRWLFVRRDHPDRGGDASGDPQERLLWLDPTLAGAVSFPVHRLVHEYAAAIDRVPLDPEEKARCRRVLQRYVEEGRDAKGASIRKQLAAEAAQIEALKVRAGGGHPARQELPSASA